MRFKKKCKPIIFTVEVKTVYNFENIYYRFTLKIVADFLLYLMQFLINFYEILKNNRINVYPTIFLKNLTLKKLLSLIFLFKVPKICFLTF